MSDPPGSPPSDWSLSDSHSIFMVSSFFCEADSTIECDTDAADGYACTSGRVMSPLNFPENVCGACGLGLRMDDLSGACGLDKCDVCHGGDCLICEDEYLLVPAVVPGQHSCQSSCDPGTHSPPGGGRCLADSPAPAVSLGPPEPLFSTAGASVRAVFPSRLALSSSGKCILQPPSSLEDPSHGNWVALRSGDGWPLWLVAPAPGAGASAPAAREMTCPELMLSSMDVSMAVELPPAPSTPSGEYVTRLVLCTADNAVHLVEITCSPDSDAECLIEGNVARRALDRAPPCDSLQGVSEHQVSIRTADDRMVLLSINAEDGTCDFTSLPPATWHPVLFPSVQDQKPSSKWVLLSHMPRTGSPSSTLHSMDLLLANDPRVQVGLHMDALRKPAGQQLDTRHLQPVLLAGGSQPPGGLLFLSGLMLVLDHGLAWVVGHAPLGGRPHGRTADIPLNTDTLGILPGPRDPVPAFASLAVRLPGSTDFPGVLLLLTETHLGVALVHCPQGPDAACWPQPARFFPLALDGPAPGLLRASAAVMPMGGQAGGPGGSSSSAPGGLAVRRSGAPAPGPALEAALILAHEGLASGAMVVSLQDDPCPEGTYGPACEACAAGCTRCTGPHASDCTACKHWLPGHESMCLAECTGPTRPTPGAIDCKCDTSCKQCMPISLSGSHWASCTECQPGYALSSPTGEAGPPARALECARCHDTCETCSHADDRRMCTSCKQGAFLFGGACEGQCPDFFFGDVASRSCQPCLENCAACADDSKCGTCAAGFYLDDLHTACIACDATCSTCAGPGACSACRPGLVFLEADDQVDSLCGGACPPGEYAGDTRCTKCHETCALCAGDAGSCQVCADRHRWQAGRPAPGATAPCVPCPAGCASCTDKLCLSCEPDLYLTHLGECLGTCSGGTFADDDTATCQPCDVSCAACAGGRADQCTGCSPGLDRVPADAPAFACKSPCPEAQYRDPLSEACLPCDPACATCNGPSDGDCWRCTEPDKVLQGGRCVQACAERHVAQAGRCLPCHASCRACSGIRSTDCVDACPADLLALPAGASPMRCVAGCPVGYNAGHAGCSECVSHCVRCSASVDTCDMCERGWFLGGSACVGSCPANTSPQGGLCIDCHKACLTCFGTQANQCATCQSETPFLVDGACLAACPDGTFQDGPSCLPCHGSCGTCSGPGAGECLACPAGRAMLDGSCVGKCPSSHFEDAGQAAGSVCRPCAASCASCAGPDADECTSCHGIDLLFEGRCVDECPAGTFGCSASGRCDPCDARCAECTLAAHLGDRCTADCHTCRAGFVLSPSTHTCDVACPAGEFTPDSVLCAACDADCRSCHGQANACTSCADASRWLLVDGAACVSSCPGEKFAAAEFPSAPFPAPTRQLKAARMTPAQVTLFQNEVALMWLLRDAPNVVRLYGYSDQPPAIVMERYQTDLATLLHSDVPLDQATILDIVQQWASGLEAMHAQGIAHRDLKPANVFVSQHAAGAWIAALGDLGTSRNLSTDRSSALVNQAPELNALTGRYAAPEVLAAFHRKRPLESELLLPADIYSAAVMLWECLARAIPWHGCTFDQISAQVLSGVRPPADGLHGPLADLLHMAWDSNGHTRPPAAALRQKAAMAALSADR
ncbi:TKL protein kinase [Fonticula alba]|uniref:TKL protein kinase n=1 Tax=Fonticula alba TaxID=691883 RepID=A0A058Z1I5_FONAL|nr:TKL protein kinase [Fonticula alba]KCV68144.1 TKL protein kinase [Fonticula alba]|eukprot:XP_009497518.1 TKL protein kinase [Fonticula alba]